MMKNNDLMDVKLTLNTLVKGALGAIPVAGTLLVELFEYRGNVKQKRLNHFVMLLAEYLEVNNEADVTNIKTDEFADLFESVIKLATLTDSKDKLQRFKNIILNQMQAGAANDYSETFLDLVNRLSETQIFILFEYSKFKLSFAEMMEKKQKLDDDLISHTRKLEEEQKSNRNGWANNYSVQLSLVREISAELKEVTTELSSRRSLANLDNYNLTKGNYQFALQDLYSKALLIDSGIGRIDTSPFQLMDITEFGREFLRFIELK